MPAKSSAAVVDFLCLIESNGTRTSRRCSFHDNNDVPGIVREQAVIEERERTKIVLGDLPVRATPLRTNIDRRGRRRSNSNRKHFLSENEEIIGIPFRVSHNSAKNTEGLCPSVIKIWPLLPMVRNAFDSSPTLDTRRNFSVFVEGSYPHNRYLCRPDRHQVWSPHIQSGPPRR